MENKPDTSLSEAEFQRKHKKNQQWIGIVSLILAASWAWSYFNGHPWAQRDWVAALVIYFGLWTAEYVRFNFERLMRKLDGIEYKLDVISDASGEVKQVMTTLRSIEHKLDVL